MKYCIWSFRPKAQNLLDSQWMSTLSFIMGDYKYLYIIQWRIWKAHF